MKSLIVSILNRTESAKENTSPRVRIPPKSWKVEKVTKQSRPLEEDSPVAAVLITGGLLGVVWNQCSHYSASSFFFQWPFLFNSWALSLCYVLCL